MSLINTNYNSLETMGIAEDNPLVGVIVLVYYLGCAGRGGRMQYSFVWRQPVSDPSLCSSPMSEAPTGPWRCMLVGRVVMGLGVSKYLADMQP